MTMLNEEELLYLFFFDIYLYSSIWHLFHCGRRSTLTEAYVIPSSVIKRFILPLLVFLNWKIVKNFVTNIFITRVTKKYWIEQYN